MTSRMWLTVGEEHDETVDSDPEPPGGRHAVFEGPEKSSSMGWASSSPAARAPA